MGLGIKLLNATSQHVSEKYGYRIMGKFSSVPVFKAMTKDPNWKNMGTQRKLGKMNFGSIERKTGFRQYGVTTYHFEYLPNKQS